MASAVAQEGAIRPFAARELVKKEEVRV